MKKPKKSMELDDLDLDLDSTEEFNIEDLDLGSSTDDDDIIELTDMIIDGMDEGPFDSDDFEFDLEALDKQSGRAVEGFGGDRASEQATLLDGDEVRERDIFSHLNEFGSDNETIEVRKELSRDVFADDPESLSESLIDGLSKAEERDQESPSGFDDSGDETLLEQTVLDRAEAVTEHLATTSEELLNGGSLAHKESSREMEAVLDEFVGEIETRLLKAVEQMVESRLPDIVRAFLSEEIDKLRKEFRQ